MKNKKWLKPLIVLVVVIAVIAVAVAGIQGYLASRSVSLTMGDVVTTVYTLSSYFVALGIIVAIALLVVLAAFKLKQPLRSLVRMQGLAAVILAVAVIANLICMGPEYGIINNAFGDTYLLSDATIADSEQLVREIADEGIVLLKNDNNALPLDDVTKLNVFGWSSTNPIYGGTGSGSVDESTCVTLLQGLQNSGFELNTAISDFYTNYLDTRPPVEMGGQDWTVPEPTLDEYDAAGIFENAKSFSDTALVVIARSAGENADLPTSITDEDTFEFTGGWSGCSGVRYSSNPDDIDPSKSYLELSNREIAMLERVKSEFNQVIVVINSAGAMELGFLEDSAIQGALWMAGFLDFDSAVQYPFGYGLSYTTFEQSITDFQNDGTNVTVTVNVKNTGSVAGKDVVELYYTPPYYNGGIEKSSVNLIDFGKTDIVDPGKEASVTITFALEDMASYDYSGVKADGGAYVLEAGEYDISLRSDSHTVIDSRQVTVSSDIIYNDANDGKRSSDQATASNLFDYAAGDVTYLSRKDGFSNYAEATAAPTDMSMTDTVLDGFYCQNTFDASKYDDPNAVMPVTGAKNGLTIEDMADVAYDDAKWDSLLDQLTISEMNQLIGTGGYANAKVDSIGLPATIECDGPAAIKNNYTGQSGTAYPAATMIAATWSKELATRRGQSMGRQCDDMNVVGWYGPAMNIHRTPFSGRNFEYYSEDGILSGRIGACEVSGAKEYGVQCYIKHFALNDSESFRKNMLCTWTNEQAMREIYLKPFEISVKDGGADNVMTAFNYIGNVWAGCCPELLQDVLRGEWGFVGSTVTDWFNGTIDGNMMADSAIRTGGDKMLSSAGDQKGFATNTDQAATVVAMRNSCHNILYSLANSNAINERNFGTPGWVKMIYAVDVVVAVTVAALEAFAIMNFLKKRKSSV